MSENKKLDIHDREVPLKDAMQAGNAQDKLNAGSMKDMLDIKNATVYCFC